MYCYTCSHHACTCSLLIAIVHAEQRCSLCYTATDLLTTGRRAKPLKRSQSLQFFAGIVAGSSCVADVGTASAQTKLSYSHRNFPSKVASDGVVTGLTQILVVHLLTRTQRSIFSLSAVQARVWTGKSASRTLSGVCTSLGLQASPERTPRQLSRTF